MTGKAKPGVKRPTRGISKGISAQEVHDVEEMSAPRTPVIYEVVRRLGEDEMARPATSRKSVV